MGSDPEQTDAPAPRASPTPQPQSLQVTRAEGTRDSAGPDDDDDEDELESSLTDGEVPPGSFIGRYLSIEEVGQGGMSRVYRAYDPKLQREVAIKVLRPRKRSSTKISDHQARLVREARAMASLSHPNVLPVYDVDEHGGGIYIAMEFVDGWTLREWRDTEKPGWRELLEKMLVAGEGLAAAHEAGLVHRDFKPSNVLLGRNGRVRVMDFGVAQIIDPDASSVSRPEVPVLDSGSSFDRYDDATTLTRHGTVVGTPAYMAPEQHVALATDARCDQYAFCVSLYELICRARPFDAKSLQRLVHQKMRGKPKPPPKGMMPPWLRTIIERGLAVDASDRYATMRDLLDDIARHAEPRRWWRLGAVGFGIVGLGASALAIASRDDPCALDQDRLEAVWNDDIRDELVDALTKTERPYAKQVADRVLVLVDDYTETWRMEHVEACRATHVRHEQSPERLELRVACIDGRLSELDALLDVLRSADSGDDTLRRAVQAVSQLPRFEPCRDGRHLLAEEAAPESAELREKTEALREDLREVGALRRAGRYRSGVELARTLLEEAEALDHPPLVAEARFALGQVLAKSGEPDEARSVLEEAFFAARRLRLERLATDIAIRLVFAVGRLQERHEDALSWSRHARAGLDGLEPEPIREAQLLSNIASVYTAQARYEDAVDMHQQALEIRRREQGDEAVQVGVSYNNLANAYARMGRHEDALAGYRAACGVFRTALGERHPEVANCLGNMGASEMKSGRVDAAIDLHREALSLQQLAFGRKHRVVAATMLNLGAALSSKGKLQDARRKYEDALEIFVETLGEQHPNVAHSHHNLGNLLQRVEDYDAAERHYEKALELRRRRLGDEHPEVASTYNNLGSLWRRRGNAERAQELHDKALSLAIASVGPDHPLVASCYSKRGLAYASAGDWQHARTDQLTALTIRRKRLGPEHPLTALSLHHAGEAAHQLGDDEVALAELEAAAQVRKGGDEDEADTSRLLADVLEALAREPDRVASLRARADAIAAETAQ